MLHLFLSMAFEFRLEVDWICLCFRTMCTSFRALTMSSRLLLRPRTNLSFLCSVRVPVPVPESLQARFLSMSCKECSYPSKCCRYSCWILGMSRFLSIVLECSHYARLQTRLLTIRKTLLLRLHSNFQYIDTPVVPVQILAQWSVDFQNFPGLLLRSLNSRRFSPRRLCRIFAQCRIQTFTISVLSLRNEI